MYKLSSDLNDLISLCKKLVLLNIFRYKLIVDLSERKEECPYAIQCIRISEESNEKRTLKNLLEEIKNIIEKILEQL